MLFARLYPSESIKCHSRESLHVVVPRLLFSPQNANNFSRCHFPFSETVKQIVQKLFALTKGRHSKRRLRFVQYGDLTQLINFFDNKFSSAKLRAAFRLENQYQHFCIFLSVHSLLLRPYEAAFLCLISFCNCK